MFFGGLKFRRPSKKRPETNQSTAQVSRSVGDHAVAPSSISPVRKNRQYVNSKQQLNPNTASDDGGDFWTELAEAGAPLSPYSMLKQMTQGKKQKSQQQQNTKSIPSTSFKAPTRSKGQIASAQKSKHKKGKSPDKPNRQNQTSSGGNSSAVHRLKQLKSSNKVRAGRRSILKSNTTQVDAAAAAPSPFTVFQRQAALAKKSKHLQDEIDPERMTSGMPIAGSLSAREETLVKNNNSARKPSPSEKSLEALESKELDDLTSVELDQLYQKSIKSFEHLNDQWLTLHANVHDSPQTELLEAKSPMDKLEEELQRSRKEISTLLAALDLTQARFEEKGTEVEKLREKLATIPTDSRKDIKDHYDVIARKWSDEDKEKLIHALYNAKYEKHVIEDELVRSRGESRRDRLAYNNLLNEKFEIIVNKCKTFSELESATALQLASMKRRIADLEEESKIAQEVYKSRLNKLHDRFAQQFVAMKESKARSCSSTT